MKIFLFGAGNKAKRILERIGKFPENIQIIGFIDNDASKWGKYMGRPVFSPKRMCECTFDRIIVMSDIHFEEIKEGLIDWYGIDARKIERSTYLLQLLLMEKYRESDDEEIQDILEYWENGGRFSVYNQYLPEGEERHSVEWDCMENMPYIWFEDKKMYFPYDYKFQKYDGRKVVLDVSVEQQKNSPHCYIEEDIKIEQGDVVADAVVREGNFALKYIEKVSKAYLFECDSRWIKPLQKTFEKFKDKVTLCERFLGRINGGSYTSLDSIVDSRLDFLKMDIEGAETDALLGGRECLKRNNVKCAICSYHQSSDEMAIKDILNGYGYKTRTSKGYMLFYYGESIYSTLDFRRGIVYARK